MTCVIVTSLVRTLELEFFSYQPRPILLQNNIISVNKELVESLCEKLQSLMEQFDEHKMDGVEALKTLESKLGDVASRVEDEIEHQVADLHVEKTSWPRLKLVEEQDACLELHHTLQQAMQDIDLIEDELARIKMESKDARALQGRNTTLDVLSKIDQGITTGASSQHTPYDIMVGKNNEFQTIKEMLLEHPSKQREVVSIKGMGGIGKTTLAKRLYEDPSIASHFDKRAWVVASQHHNKRQMLVDLFKSIFKEDQVEHHTDEYLAEKLYQVLKRQRYLIVIDDVWSGDVWDAIRACLPDDRNGSRVLLTTRLEHVANYTHSGNDFSHQVHLLDQSESWNLFYEKVLLKGAEFEIIAGPIVEKCKGLPLAVVVVAGLFSKLKTLEEWKYVAEALNSSAITTIDEECSRILSFSYNHLPHNLKACFLYLGVFPEDFKIDANELARLWAAEGLVKVLKNESLQVVGQKHVQELFDRNLILVSKQKSNGRRIKTFHIHDVVHAFCVREAQNENLLKVVREDSSNIYEKDFRWLSIQSSSFDVQTLRSSSKNCRSIFCFLKGDSGEVNLQNTNMLRVLHVKNISCDVSCKYNQVYPPVHLRYIHLEGASFSLAPFSLLSHNLQSIYRGEHTFSLDNHPHLCYVFSLFNPLSSIHQYPPKFVHQFVQIISYISVSSCTKELFTKIPYLKELGISVDNENSVVDCIGHIGNLAYLQQLESLRIRRIDEPIFECPICIQISLLKNLKNLTFYYTKFRWEEINVLSTLPRLKVLTLGWNACKGQKWILREEEKFCQLVFLELQRLNLKHWEVNADHFPKLECLLIHNCRKLKEIPSSFSEISTLKSIELQLFLPSLANSAKQIQEEQNDQGNYDMIVIEKSTPQPFYTDINSEEETGKDSEEESGKSKEGDN